jgi:hypothetical protein
VGWRVNWWKVFWYGEYDFSQGQNPNSGGRFFKGSEMNNTLYRLVSSLYLKGFAHRNPLQIFFCFWEDEKNAPSKKNSFASGKI